MRQLIKPDKLMIGDTVATVSSSLGVAGDADMLWRYNVGVQRLESLFGLRVKAMENTLKGTAFVYANPKLRAEDFTSAFADSEVKGIISCIGGDDSIRMLEYIDYEVIRATPKIFIGYSDTTISHFICLKAGITSYYGACVLNDFAENGGMFDYTIDSINKTLFSGEVIGDISPSDQWTAAKVKWSDERIKNKRRKTQRNNGYDLLQGSGRVTGRLIGGCVESLYQIVGTAIFPNADEFDDSILFLEVCGNTHACLLVVTDFMRVLGAKGILKRSKGILIGKPTIEKIYKPINDIIIAVLKEYGREDMPVLANCSFGHASPRMVVPYGVLASIDCDESKWSILESGVN